MASIYIASVLGDGLSPSTAFRAAGFDGISHTVLMIDEARSVAMVASGVDTVIGAGITLLLTGPTWDELRANGKRNTPNPSQRRAFNTWLTGGGLEPLTAAQTTWEECVLYAARQVNPAANLDTIYVGG